MSVLLKQCAYMSTRSTRTQLGGGCALLRALVWIGLTCAQKGLRHRAEEALVVDLSIPVRPIPVTLANGKEFLMPLGKPAVL